MLPTHSTPTSKIEVKRSKITTMVIDGDTFICMSLNDAKIVLTDLLDYQIIDSLLSVYENRDSLQSQTISLQKETILLLQEKSNNQETQKSNLEKILANKDLEISYKDSIIEEREKEIDKQKRLKRLFMLTTIITTLLGLIY
jgi:hypothetical protein